MFAPLGRASGAMLPSSDGASGFRRAYRVAGEGSGARGLGAPARHRHAGRRAPPGDRGFAGFGRELEVLLLLCVVACVPLLSSGTLPSSRRLHRTGNALAVDPEDGAHGTFARAHAGTLAKGEAAMRTTAASRARATTPPPPPPPSDDEAERNPPAESSATAAAARGASRSTSTTPSSPSSSSPSLCGAAGVHDGVDIRGGDLRPSRGPLVRAPATAAECCAACEADAECVAWVLVKDGGVCWLKGRFAGRAESDPCCVASDARGGNADAAAREAARRTAELDAQRTSLNEASSEGASGASSESSRGGSLSFFARSSGGRGSSGGSGRGEDFTFSRPFSSSSLARSSALGERSSSLGSLLIVVPTVARRGAEYLTRTLDSLLREARASAGAHGFDRVTIRVVSHSPASEHAGFRAALDRAAGAEDMAKKISLECAVDADRRRVDPGARDAEWVDDRDNPGDVPGPRVRQQTLDLVGVLRDVGGVGGGGGAETLLLTEDDAVMCEGGLVWLGEAIASANRVDPRWSMVRTSVGFIGIATRRADAYALADFLETHYEKKPPDILLIEWVHGDWEGSVRERDEARARGGSGRGSRESSKSSRGDRTSPSPRRHFVATRNAFEHVGAVSSLRETGLGHGPQCGAALTSFLWATERFEDAAKCRGKGVVPCE